ncbi:hypothetical protein LACWKB8_0312 [Lactobacillus sp. wkB8]|nr:hypothetical protein [Lactobacillus sp. wkB8]AIS08628.1 hypothetical protein LACWKB8_0312 [Lactobacillus sp. wkB8]
MLYLLYIFIGLLIILITDLMVTSLLTLKDIFHNHAQDKLDFSSAFKKYFAKNNNLFFFKVY